jgi:hypothetical protein
VLVRSLLVAASATLALGACTAQTGARTQPGPPDVGAGSAEVHALAVLHAWDARRAAAYARGDVPALRRLYVDGSRAGTRDARTLRGYVDLGLHVEGLRMQVLRAAVLRDDRRVVRVQVRERLASGRASSGAGDGVALPRDRADDHVVTLVRRRGAWVVRSVSSTGSSCTRS